MQRLRISLKKREMRTGKVEALVVEDHPFARTMLATIVKEHTRVHLARNGSEAINVYAETAPDIVFLDIELPDFNGHDLANLFRSIDPKAYIIMVTANSTVEHIKMAKESNIQGYVIKTYTIDRMQKIVAAFLKTRTP